MNYKKIWSKQHSLRLGENWSYGPLQFERIFGVKFPNQFIGYRDGFGTGFVDAAMLDKCFEHVIGQLYTHGFEEYFEHCALPIFQNFLSYAKEVSTRTSPSLPQDDLHELWKQYLVHEDEWMNYVWMVFLLDEGLTTELRRIMPELPNIDYERLLPAMVAPSAKTAAYRLRIDLLNTAVQAQNGVNIDPELDALTHQYAYFSILNMSEKPLDVDHFRTEVRTCMQNEPKMLLKQLEEDEHKIVLLYQEVVEALRERPDALRLVEAMRKVAYYREYRNDLRQESYYYARTMYQEIARRAGVPLTRLIFATRSEIEGFFEDTKLPDEIVLIARHQCSALISDYEQGAVRYEFEEEGVRAGWPDEGLNINVQEITGTVAYKGKVTGRVHIISDVATQGDEFKEGEVLVATTTNLLFVPIISKAVAIVTDDGGLLTHAAIVAREYKTPAIVGTKVGTKVLKNGDLVEVDADTGVVKIVQRAS